MSFKKSLISILAAASVAVGVAGCDLPAPENYIQGEVIERYGNVAGLASSEIQGPFTYGETVKIGDPNYIMRVKTDQGIYTIEVDADGIFGTEGTQTIYSVAGATKIGTQIRFATSYRESGSMFSLGKELFSSSKIGILDPDDIEILQ